MLFAADLSHTIEHVQQQYPELEADDIRRIQNTMHDIKPKTEAAQEITESEVESVSESVEGQNDAQNIVETESGDTESSVPVDTSLKNIVEAILFAANRCMTPKQIQVVFPELEQPEVKQIQAAIDEISIDYQNRPIALKKLASGYRFQVKAGLSPWISRLFEEKPPRYSRALLETLSIIAYRQPVTRGEIEDIRGVSVSSNIIRTLLDREWIRIIAHKEVPGRPALYGTTKQFLDYFNLSSLEQLPTLDQINDLDLMAEPNHHHEGQEQREQQEKTAPQQKQETAADKNTEGAQSEQERSGTGQPTLH
ncbi:SMC-Scp complex subunit ScpB [methane-oxidizing endosymbiont of Gigantopelta aegis]|uniref:SMC-Scp complex subunit ScpB n=1 Tax=methane-oxidizing endosymbiont of Gigantopelta aegis TaxID=2794938 RepID=UPI001FD9F0DB|nr:SMC-Scp complex subunit ScpB [methane-oxidizing endosymbiont of Gigantopelta aegis]